MKKLIIYPYSQDFQHIVEYREHIAGYELSKLIVSKSYSPQNSCQCDESSALISTDYYSEVNKCDAVLLTLEPHLVSKEAEVARSLNKELIQPSINLNFRAFDTHYSTSLSRIGVPVIAIMGQGENTQKFEVQLGLREVFQRMGYRVLQFGTKHYSEIFGMHCYPECNELPLWKKIIMLNKHFAQLIEETKPDVMILGVPGGMMPVNAIHHNLFGEIAIAVCEAASPDIAIVSFYENLVTDGMIEMSTKYAEGRLGSSIDYVHVSNCKMSAPVDQQTVSYLRVPNEQVVDRISQINLSSKVFNCDIKPKAKSVYAEIIEELQCNIDVI